MDLTSLKDFLELSRYRSFSRAAEARNVTQPAFSRRIKALEAWVGVDLIDRSSHPITLTEPGEQFLDHAERLVSAFDETLSDMQATQRERDETLRFATTQVLSLTFFPSWLKSIATRMPIGKVNLESNSLLACERTMLDGKAQFLLCHYYENMPWRLDPEEFRSVSVLPDRLIPVSAPDAGGRPQYCLEKPSDEPLPLLDYDEYAGLGRIFRSVFDIQTNTPPLNPVVASHLALILGLALDGQGIAWVPESVARNELDQGTLVEAGGLQWSIAMEIRLFRPLGPLGAAAEKVWEMVSG